MPNAQQNSSSSDPYAEFGGQAIQSAPAAVPVALAASAQPQSTASATTGQASDPYAEFGGATLNTGKQAQPNQPPQSSTPSAVSPWQFTKGVVGEAYDTAKGLASSIEPPALHGDTSQGAASLLPPAYTNAVQGVEDLPDDYRAYEAARAQGKSPLDAFAAASGVNELKKNAVSAIEARLKEFKTNPSKATGKAVADLAPFLLTLGGSAPEVLEAKAATEAAPTVAYEAINPIETRTSQEVAKFGLPEGAPAAGVRAPAQRITIEPPKTTTTTAAPEGKLILSPEEAAAQDRIQSVASKRASEQGMRSAANMPRLGSIEPLPEETTSTVTPGRVVPGKEFLTTYADNPSLANLPPTESQALTELIRPNVKAGQFYGTNVDWTKTLQRFDKLSSDEQAARFSDPAEVRDGLRRQAAIQSVKSTLMTGAKLTALEEFLRRYL